MDKFLSTEVHHTEAHRPSLCENAGWSLAKMAGRRRWLWVVSTQETTMPAHDPALGAAVREFANLLATAHLRLRVS